MNAPMPVDDLDRCVFVHPAVRLSGAVDYPMYERFRQQLDAAQGPVVVIELGTLGGDPEVARMMGTDIRFISELQPERRFVFLGKTAVYSAGATFMGFFHRDNRYLAHGTRLMIHERKMSSTVQIEGPLEGCIAPLKAVLAEIETSIDIEREGFGMLVAGSSVTVEDVIARAPSNWYIGAEEAKSLGLVRDVI